MAFTILATIPGTTTLSALTDLVYVRQAGVTGAPTFRALDFNTVVAQWPNSHAQIEIKFTPRSVYPDNIRIS